MLARTQGHPVWQGVQGRPFWASLFLLLARPNGFMFWQATLPRRLGRLPQWAVWGQPFRASPRMEREHSSVERKAAGPVSGEQRP